MRVGGGEVAIMGRWDLLVYEGRRKGAIALLQQASSSSAEKLDDSTLATYSILTAEAKLAAGKESEATANAKSALAHDSSAGTQFAAGLIYVKASQYAAVQALVSQLSGRIDADSQAYGKLLDGEMSLKRGDARQAILRFQESQRLSDTWIGRFDLGRAYIEAGAFPEADSAFENCLKRRGEASALYLDDVPTFRVLPPVNYYLGT